MNEPVYRYLWGELKSVEYALIRMSEWYDSNDDTTTWKDILQQYDANPNVSDAPYIDRGVDFFTEAGYATFLLQWG